MKIVDKTKDKQEEQWQLGDVLKSCDGDLALIANDNNFNNCLMDISSNGDCYSTSPTHRISQPYYSLNELQKDYSYKWHKVNAKLVIE